MKNIKRIILFLFLPVLMLAQDAWVNADLWKLSGTALTPVNTAWTLTLPATTFSPSIVTPLIIGGTGTTSTLTYRTTSGVGATGARHIFQVGTNGGTEAMTILNDGKVGIGTVAPSQALSVGTGFYIALSGNVKLGNGGQGIGIDPVAGGTAANIYFGAGGIITFPNLVTIFTGGNVGIGTTTPLHKQSTVASAATNQNAFNFVQSDINKIRTTVPEVTDTSSFSLKYSSLGSPTLSLKGKTGNSMIYVDSVGVGIGMVSPGYQLETTENAKFGGIIGIGTNPVAGYSIKTSQPISMETGQSLDWAGGNARIKESGYNLYFQTYTGSALTDKMIISGSGNLGLGTATPYAQYSQVGATPIWYITDSDVNKSRTTLATATDTSAIKIDASVAQPTITVKNTTGGGYIATTTTGTSTLTSLLGVMTLVDSTGLYSLTTAVAGWGEVLIGDNQEWAHFRFTASGVVTLIANSTNVSTTVNTVNKLNIYDAGTGIAIQNNLGSDLKLAVDIKYYTP